MLNGSPPPPAWRFDSPVQFDADLAVAVGAGWTLFQAVVHRQSARLRGRWLAAAAMLLLAAIQATDWLVDGGVIGDDWYIDLPLWVIVSAILYRLLRAARAQGPALHAWRVGLCLQVVYVACDFGDERLADAWLGSPHAVASLTEWAELLTIEAYVVALLLLELAPGAAPLRRAALAVGAEARRLFVEASLFRKASYPAQRWLHYPGLRAATVVAGEPGTRRRRRAARAAGIGPVAGRPAR